MCIHIKPRVHDKHILKSILHKVNATGGKRTPGMTFRTLDIILMTCMQLIAPNDIDHACISRG